MPIPDATFTLAAAKEHLRVEHAEEDALISARLDAAVMAVEQFTGVAWCDRPAITCRIPPNASSFVLPLAVVKTIDSVQYLRDDATLQPWPVGGYFVRSLMNGQQEIILTSFPTDAHPERGEEAIVTYTAQAPGGAVPAAIVAGAMLHLGDLYESREANIVGTIVAANPAVMSLIMPFRINLGV